MNEDERESARRGLWFAVAAYGAWGLIPLYFKLLVAIAPTEVLAHRVVWSFVFLLGVMAVVRRWSELAVVLRNRWAMATLVASTVLIAANWFTFIDAVTRGEVLQASLGYFITPLANVLLGLVFLGERLRPAQWLAVLLAAAGVANLTLASGHTPWIALALVTTFSLYGLLRKTVAADALLGLFVETAILLPSAIAYLVWLGARGQGTAMNTGTATLAALLLSGVVTAVPLLCFAAGARRLRLATLGLIQYLAPSLQFLVAVVVFGEPFAATQVVTFACIWIAVVIYTIDSLVGYRQQVAPVAAEVEASLAEP